MKKNSDIAIVGRACRLPGANSVGQLWELLRDRRCAVTHMPSDRWSLERFGHPRQNERGRSYTWAAGVLDDIWGFDPAAFGMSPREAEQMDPQQRLLLELTWEALEDAGIPPSSLSGSEVGVFVGASTTDHGNSKMFDIASTDGYFATGNAASILANRISYIYDLNGPSFTVDTACSSSLVALDAAMQALQSGRIETAIVGGVSILTTPFQFVNFSQASMLSRIGLCQAFSSKADGYVRAEGGGVLVLRAAGASARQTDRVHATIVGTRINSDGRTNGIALPSKKRQAQLLEQLYGEYGIDPDALAFVEAHGTGTPVGDPVEATALGEVLGRRRSRPLTIGSIKSNIGHTEAAAGIAGLMKAMLALEHDLLPASLHCDEPNPNIDFEGLNLRVATEPVRLERSAEPRLVGVSSYGFGGTNSHVVLADAPARVSRPSAETPAILRLSAHSRAALSDLATAYAASLEVADPATLAASANHHRDLLPERLIVPVESRDGLPALLRSFAEKGADSGPEVTSGTAVGRDSPVAFVYSGNGSQWAGMGRAAYASSTTFRSRFDAVDALFRDLSGWSLAETMNDEAIAERLGKTSVAQPLIFAIQSATTFALAALGLVPQAVFGHSVGEVAAAEAAGILDLPTAVRVIYYRSLHQELVFQHGGMTVLIGSREAAETLAAEIPGLSIGAYNSPRATTFSGPVAALDNLAAAARGLKARAQRLDIAYPFHSALIEPIRAPLLADLGTLATQAGTATFVSTVTGSALDGESLDSDYWWRNVREPVLFADAAEEAARLGCRIFVEIGPSPILLSHINDTLGTGDIQIATLSVLDRKQQVADPFRGAAATALARGAHLSSDAMLGSDPGPVDGLPSYPWQRKTYRLGDTAEAIDFLKARPWHPLVGARFNLDQLEWHSQIDTALVPVLADHVVDGHVLLPGAAFAEMALAVARDWLGTASAAIADFEIHTPMILAPNTSRDVRCRVQPVTGMVEIMSRQRLGPVAWQVHAVAKILRAAGPAEAPPAWTVPADAAVMAGPELYPLAAASGLQYGPAFQLLDRATQVGPGRIVVDLLPGETDPRYGLDPARVDACFHGLALLYADLAVNGRLKPYVPVGVAEFKMFRPGAAVTRAYIDVVRSDERTIVMHYTLVDADNQPVAQLYRARFQAMNAFRATERPIDYVGQKSILAAEPLAVQEQPAITSGTIVAAARATDRIADAGTDGSAQDYVLMDGWATAVAFGLFEVLADNGVVDLESLLATGRLPEALRGWATSLLSALQRSGLVERTDQGLVVASDAELPDPKDILRALSADHPERSSELLLAARTGALVDAMAAGSFDMSLPVTPTAVDSFEFGALSSIGSASLVSAVLEKLGPAWPKDRAMRVLQVGDGPLSGRAARIAERQAAEFTLLEPDRRRFERARLGLDKLDRVSFVGGLDQLAPGSFDVVIASQALHRLVTDRAGWEHLAEAMAPGAVLIAVEPEGSVFRDIVFGLHDAMLQAAAGVAPVAPPATSQAGWTRVLADLGLTGVSVLPTNGTDHALLCIGQKSAVRTTRAVKGDALVIGGDGPLGDIAAALATMLKFSGLKVSNLVEAFNKEKTEVPETVVYLSQASSGLGPAEQLAERCMALKQLVAAIGPNKTTVWIVCPGATRATPDNRTAVEAGVWAFARTLANEIHSLDIRLVDLMPGLSADVAARRLRDVVLSGTAETEIILDASGTRVVRFEKLALDDGGITDPETTVLRLSKGENSSLDKLRWLPETRRAPDADEVEIAVEAAGLNFRDVMWGLSILPEEILEDGYAGATLGLECAGTVVRVGPGVTRFQVGDKVLAFAKAALATHATVDIGVVAPVPAGMSMAAAATVPVAFLTAYYALIRCARLAEDEWVLIHGGAGGVGLAALEIARWRGARVIATAGSTERRDLLIALGADHVFDSRSSQFVDDIRRVTGSGVDVVLNSLSGDAMERSIAVLKPFGRFVELGKRDYVANTHIGLKPFRRNLSYFGVDLDQLLLKGDATGQTLFDDVMALFDEGALTALPYRVFDSEEVVDAFRIMQRSGHVGKIVILPPATPKERAAALRPFEVDATRSHLITGGLGGFGIETARWLVARGARHLVLVGRSGATSPEAQAALAEFAAAGVVAKVAALDITDEAAVRALLAEVAAGMPPLAGIIHAATVFDDAIVANLTRARLDGVLAAKVTGAVVLDRLSRDMDLDYFVLYSSATTVIGNPGQGAYVAANAFLEGIARSRRLEGRPALAVAWGAIEDVGILARSASSTTNLLARSGVLGMVARTALDHLAAAVPHLATQHDPAVLTVAAVNWSTAREHLPVLRSRSFSELMHGVQVSEAGDTAKINVQALIDQEGLAGASKKIVDTILEEIARILRLPREDVSRNKPLMEIGLDSLMAVELGMGLEQRFTLESPLSSSAGAMTVTELGDYIIGSAGKSGGADQTSESLALRHLDADTRKEMMEALPGLQGSDFGRKEIVS